MNWPGHPTLQNVAEFRTPGQAIQARLEERGWTRKTLAVVVGLEETKIRRLITGQTRLDADTALVLGEALELDAETLLGIQASYELAEARLRYRPDPGLRTRSALFASLPISEMVKRRWLRVDSYSDVQQVSAELARFWGAEASSLIPHAAKRASNGPTPLQMAWVRRVQELAQEMIVAKYSPASMEEAVQRLRELRSSIHELRNIPRILAEAGIRFVIVEALPGSKIDGACLWVNDTSPVVGMSLRYDRIDNFWFVLRHELEHVRHGHGKSAPLLDAELEGDNAGTEAVSDEERIANSAAAEFCVPQEKLKSFIARKSPFFAERDIEAFSKVQQVHPGLVAGQLQRHTGRYDLFRKHQVKVRAIVSPGSMVDGWGDVAPV